jgi:preprotein translocase subunit SecG
MYTIVLVLHVIAAAAIIGLVLVQHGKGADMGAAFGSGSAGSLFGSAGAANFLSRSTAVLAAMFFVTSLGLTFFTVHNKRTGGIMDQLKSPPGKVDSAPTTTVAPAAPVAPAPSAPAPAAPENKSGEVPK